MSFEYLGSPYTYPSENKEIKSKMQRARYHAVMVRTVSMLKEGIHVYSPIVHCHVLAMLHDMPTDAEFWKEYNYAMLSKASKFHLLMLPGWDESLGLRGESEHARACSIPEFLHSPTPEELAWLGI